MKLFVSYSFKDAPAFDDILRLLAVDGIDSFNTAEMTAGSSLSDQLRDALAECDACLFIATHNSVKSAWCNAELGGFWGAKKPVVIYVADSSLKESQLPKQFDGHLLDRSMHRAVQAAKKHLQEAAIQKHTISTATVGDLSIADLRTLLLEVAHTTAARSGVANLLFQSVSLFDQRTDATFEDRHRWGTRQLHSFIGLQLPEQIRSDSNGWRYTFTAVTTAGIWHGFALHSESYAQGMMNLYRNCLLLRLDTSDIIVAAALVEVVSFPDRALALQGKWTDLTTENVIAMAGGDLGEAVPESL
jgi:TIR domain